MSDKHQEIKSKVLMGLSIPTSFIKETNPLTSEIGKLVARYFQEKVADKIPDRKNPNVTICTYSNYSNKYLGDYVCFIGEEVAEDTKVPAGMVRHEIPAATYMKFTTEKGAVPFNIMKVWQKIWQMFEGTEHGNRLYQVDFQVHDERAADPLNAIVDIYVGVSSS